LKLSNENFKRRIGTTKPVFQTMLDILKTAHDIQHKQGGKPPDLTVGDKLLITLKDYREYTTMWSPSPTMMTAPKVAFAAPLPGSKMSCLPMVVSNCPAKKHCKMTNQNDGD
jgi:hypothetical protein